MAKFGEMSLGARAGILFLAAAMVGAAYYYIYFNPMYQANQQLDAKIKEKKAVGINGGWFGRATVVTHKRVELVILLTARIVAGVAAQ